MVGQNAQLVSAALKINGLQKEVATLRRLDGGRFIPRASRDCCGLLAIKSIF
jgi:hypothetical protein